MLMVSLFGVGLCRQSNVLIISQGPRKIVWWIWLFKPSFIIPSIPISSQTAELSHNSLFQKIFFQGKQEEISRFILRFDCLFSPLVRPQMNWAARTQDIDTNSIELKSRNGKSKGERREILEIEIICDRGFGPWENIQLKLSKRIIFRWKISLLLHLIAL